MCGFTAGQQKDQSLGESGRSFLLGNSMCAMAWTYARISTVWAAPSLAPIYHPGTEL